MARSIARYTEQIVVLVTPKVAKELRQRARRRRVSLGTVVREVIDAGLSEVEEVRQ